jgi:pyruvate-ferredoxin/flavodoxin oxidoreductase
MACSTSERAIALFCSGSVQGGDGPLGCVHLATLKSSVPFINFFDGFRTSHEYHKIEAIDEDAVAALARSRDMKRFRYRCPQSLSALLPAVPLRTPRPSSPTVKPATSNYNRVPEIVEHYLGEISKITGR